MIELITAVIKPQQLEAVRDALVEAGVQGMTVTDVRGHGRQRGATETFRGSESAIDFLPKVKVEVIVAGTDAERVVALIAEHARTGAIGDGKIWRAPIGALLRVRTGEVDAAAI